MKNLAQSIQQTLKEPENLILVIGVVVAAVLAYIGVRNNDIQQALNAILAVLGSLAIAQVIEGYETVKRDKQVETILALLQKFTHADSPYLRPRQDLIPLPSRCPNAKKILLIGHSLAFDVRYTEYFKRRLLDGAILRFVVMNPQNTHIIKSIAPLIETAEEGMVADIQTSLAFLKGIRNAAPDKSQLEIRVIEYVPPLSYAVVDGHLPSGHVVVQLFPYKSSTAMRPHLFLTPNETPQWYIYFRDICEAIWRDANELPFQ